MPRLSPKKFQSWWEAQPQGPYACQDCGRVDSKSYVQPQPEGGALCGPCIGKRNEAAREARKAQLAALPRCEVTGCKCRGNFRVAGVALLCGRHLSAAKRSKARDLARLGDIAAGLAMFIPISYTREDILRMAQGERPLVGHSEIEEAAEG